MIPTGSMSVAICLCLAWFEGRREQVEQSSGGLKGGGCVKRRGGNKNEILQSPERGGAAWAATVIYNSDNKSEEASAGKQGPSTRAISRADSHVRGARQLENNARPAVGWGQVYSASEPNNASQGLTIGFRPLNFERTGACKRPSRLAPEDKVHGPQKRLTQIIFQATTHYRNCEARGLVVGGPRGMEAGNLGFSIWRN